MKRPTYDDGFWWHVKNTTDTELLNSGTEQTNIVNSHADVVFTYLCVLMLQKSFGRRL